MFFWGGTASRQRSEIWAPILVVGDLVVPFTLQRMSDLLPSTVPLDVKLGEAGNLCDSLATKVIEEDSKNKSLKRMSKAEMLPR